jgi:acyl-coenzyme A thioesterase PaaI-like protein
MSDGTANVLPPAGFKPIADDSGFVAVNGPYYWRRDDAGELRYLFFSEQRHANPNRVVHGGAILGFLDTVIGKAVVHQTRRNCATIALDSRFVAPAAVGVWIEGRVSIKKLTRSLAFVDGEASADGELLATVSAIFRLFDFDAAQAKPRK